MISRWVWSSHLWEIWKIWDKMATKINLLSISDKKGLGQKSFGCWTIAGTLFVSLLVRMIYSLGLGSRWFGPKHSAQFDRWFGPGWFSPLRHDSVVKMQESCVRCFGPLHTTQRKSGNLRTDNSADTLCGMIILHMYGLHICRHTQNYAYFLLLKGTHNKYNIMNYILIGWKRKINNFLNNNNTYNM